MNIAIIGAGFSGLSLAWHLIASGNCTVTLYDPSGIGGGASGIAAGLMHPYPGQQGKRSFLATEGMAATKRLLAIAQTNSELSVLNDRGIIRYAQNEEMRSLFLTHSQMYGDVEPYDEIGFLIRSGITVFCQRYLQGLWRAAHKRGVVLLDKKISDLQELSSHDQIVLAAGAGSCTFAETKALRLELLKGQIVKCQIPQGVCFPAQSVIGNGYIAHAQEEGFCYLGSTYERGQSSARPDLEKAKEQLLPKARFLHADAPSFPIVDCQAAFRVMRIGHYYPMVGKLKENVWICTALGSRGLLYHGLIAERLAEAILNKDPGLLPKEFDLCPLSQCNGIQTI